LELRATIRHEFRKLSSYLLNRSISLQSLESAKAPR
jgi:hypothetical protein